MRVKSSGMAPGLANAQPPGSALKLYIFHLLLFIFLFNYLPLKNFAVCRIQEFLQFCCSFSITRTRNTAEYRLNEVYCILFSVVRLRLCYNFHAEKGAYLKYERVVHYSNDRLVGFSRSSLSIFFFFKCKVVSCSQLQLVAKRLSFAFLCLSSKRMLCTLR